MKTTLWRLGNTKSGVPGSARTCIRKRNPKRCSSFRIASSGRVFALLTEAITRLRSVAVSVSIDLARCQLSRRLLITSSRYWHDITGRGGPASPSVSTNRSAVPSDSVSRVSWQRLSAMGSRCGSLVPVTTATRAHRASRCLRASPPCPRSPAWHSARASGTAARRTRLPCAWSKPAGDARCAHKMDQPQAFVDEPGERTVGGSHGAGADSSFSACVPGGIHQYVPGLCSRTRSSVSSRCSMAELSQNLHGALQANHFLESPGSARCWIGSSAGVPQQLGSNKPRTD